MKCNIIIAGHDYSVEFDYDITSHGTSPSWTDPGDPAEWVIDGDLTLKADGHGDNKDAELEVPKWLYETICQAIYDDEKVNSKIQEASWDAEHGYIE